MNASDTQAKDTRGYYRAKGRKGYVTKTMDPIDRALLVRHNRIVWRSPCIPLFYILYSFFLSHFLNSFFFFFLPFFPSFFSPDSFLPISRAFLDSARPPLPFFLIPFSRIRAFPVVYRLYRSNIEIPVRTYGIFHRSATRALWSLGSRRFASKFPDTTTFRRSLHRCLYCACLGCAS